MVAFCTTCSFCAYPTRWARKPQPKHRPALAVAGGGCGDDWAGLPHPRERRQPLSQRTPARRWRSSRSAQSSRLPPRKKNTNERARAVPPAAPLPPRSCARLQPSPSHPLSLLLPLFPHFPHASFPYRHSVPAPPLGTVTLCRMYTNNTTTRTYEHSKGEMRHSLAMLARVLQSDPCPASGGGPGAGRSACLTLSGSGCSGLSSGAGTPGRPRRRRRAHWGRCSGARATAA